MKEKTNLHPKNKHRFGYDFEILVQRFPTLGDFVFMNKFGTKTIDFSNKNAVLALNKSLLFQYYNLTYWELPDNYLCPAIPGRADYIHAVAELLDLTKQNTTILDIGTGANLIYPIIAVNEYNWNVIASDVDGMALKNASEIISMNKYLADKIELRKQANSNLIFKGIIKKTDSISITICNPPFHKSKEEAVFGTNRKWKNLSIKKDKNDFLNFGGQHNELWIEGGEIQFVTTMINESFLFKENCNIFSTLVSKNENLKIYLNLFKKLAAKSKIIDLFQGNKMSRILVWNF